MEGDVLRVALGAQVDDYSAFARLLVERGCNLLLFEEEPTSLETAFMRLTEGLVA